VEKEVASAGTEIGVIGSKFDPLPEISNHVRNQHVRAPNNVFLTNAQEAYKYELLFFFRHMKNMFLVKQFT
jgi:hypothetical protein